MDNMDGWTATRADSVHTHIHTPHTINTHTTYHTHHTHHTHTTYHTHHTHHIPYTPHTHTTHHKHTHHIPHTPYTHTPHTHTPHTHTTHTHTHTQMLLVAYRTKPTRYAEQPGRALQETTKTSTPHLQTTRMQFMQKRRKGPQTAGTTTDSCSGSVCHILTKLHPTANGLSGSRLVKTEDDSSAGRNNKCPRLTTAALTLRMWVGPMISGRTLRREQTVVYHCT